MTTGTPLMLDIRRVNALAVVAALAACSAVMPAQGENGSKATKAPQACSRADFQTVLDVGHTAQSPGAISSRGAKEYDFNLRLATLIHRAMVEAGFEKTILLITEGPGRRGLIQRIDVANRHAANLFLSIHHDSVPTRFLEKWEFEEQELKYSDRFKGHSIFVSKDNRHSRSSVQFGTLLGLQLKERGLTYTPHYTEPFMGNRRRILVDGTAGVYRYDQLLVLKNTHMPAVLLEAGSIINRDEELVMNTSEHHAMISAAVVEAVDAFCAKWQAPVSRDGKKAAQTTSGRKQ
jgi:N-acetylmuramoyl-L-alanine amidase